jgi:hypothetical protein
MPHRRPNLLDALRKADAAPPSPSSHPPPPRPPAAPAPAPAKAPARAAGPAAPAPIAPPARAAAPRATAPRDQAAPAASATAPSATVSSTPLGRAQVAPPVATAVPAHPVPAHPVPADPAGNASALRARWLTLALIAALVTLVAVIASRKGGGADPSDGVAAAPPSGAQPAPVPAGTAPARPEPARPAVAPHDVAIHDLANRATVQLVQYPADERGLSLARETWRALTDLGYPVASPIQLAGGRGVVLCAGAAPSETELIPLRDNLRALAYPAGGRRKPFSDAFINQIDKVLAR